MVIAGADEVGRGPWAGAVVAAVVIFPTKISQNIIQDLAFLNDSKKVPKNKRKNLANIIKKEALAYSISFVDEKIIDETNILAATKLAIQNCMIEIVKTKNMPDILLIDGNYKINHWTSCTTYEISKKFSIKS